MSGFVYAIGDDAGRVKIGWSKDPLRRLSKIRSDSSIAVRLLGLVLATKEHEAELHRLFSKWRSRGEWFFLTGPVSAFVEMLPVPIPRAVSLGEVASLKTYRSASGVTQDQLADRLGVSRTTVARWETGQRKIDKGLLQKVSQITGISREALRPDLARLMGGAR